MTNLDDYTKLVHERPVKFNAREVAYKEAADIKHRCGRCMHYYERSIDAFAVCEIFRDDETDENGINPRYACKFFTRDGVDFPLLTSEK